MLVDCGSKPKPKLESMHLNTRQSNSRTAKHQQPTSWYKQGGCLSYGQANNCFALVQHLLYKNLASRFCLWSAPNCLWFGADLFKWTQAQTPVKKKLIFLSLPLNTIHPPLSGTVMLHSLNGSPLKRRRGFHIAKIHFSSLCLEVDISETQGNVTSSDILGERMFT